MNFGDNMTEKPLQQKASLSEAFAEIEQRLARLEKMEERILRLEQFKEEIELEGDEDNE